MSVPGEHSPEFEIVTTKQQFELLEPEWNALFETHGRGIQLFQTYNWVWHWINQFKTPPTNLLILTGRLNGELILIAPLIAEKRFGIKIIKWLGEPVSQYGDILLKDDVNNLQWLKAGFNYFITKVKPDLFYLRKTRLDAAITPLAENYGATILEETAAPYIEIRGDKDFTEFSKRYSQRSRKAKRRHRRKLEEKGDLTFALYKEGDAANRAALHAIALKRQWLKDTKTMSPAFSTSIIDDFFDNVTRENEHSTNIHVSELCVDNHPAALEIGVRAKDYYGAHLGVYDPQYIAHSPGSLQMQDTIAELIEQGITTIDLFAPADSYKYEWTEQAVPVYDFAYSTSLKGQAYAQTWLQHIRPGLKRLIKELGALVKKRKQNTSKKTPADLVAETQTHTELQTEPDAGAIIKEG